MAAFEREGKVWKVGGSLAVTLPAAFVDANGITAGDTVRLSFDPEHVEVFPTGRRHRSK